MFRTIFFAAAISALTACGSSDPANEPAADSVVEEAPTPPVDTASTDSAPNEASQPESEPQPVAAAETNPLLKRGRIVWLQCRSCHTLKEGEAHLTGPNLHGLMGRQAGVAEGFGFSKPLSESEIVWTEETLDTWLERPDQYIRGNIMAYAGLRRESDRDAVIAYLAEETK